MQVVSSVMEAAKGIANNTVVLVDLTGSTAHAVDDTELPALLAGFPNNTSLESLDLTLNHITDSGAALIADVFRKNPGCHLQNFELDANRITDVGAKLLIESLPPSVTRLDLSSNKLSDESLRFFMECMIKNSERYSVKALHMRDCNLTNAAMIDFLQWLSGGSCPLQTVHLSGNAFTDDILPELTKVLERSTNLTDLNLSNTNIFDFGPVVTEAALENRTLQSIALGNTLKKFTDRRLDEMLKRNKRIAREAHSGEIVQLKTKHEMEIKRLTASYEKRIAELQAALLAKK